MKKIFLGISGVLLVLALILIGQGIHKLTKYENPSSDDEYSFLDDEESVNAYVGGDAYNYIINAEQATGRFVLSGSFILAAIGIQILYQLIELVQVQRNRNNSVVENQQSDNL